ncbi:MAG: hypothetical protein HW397_35 [Dehalococcoidia bacterium]|nr:hypothetical protein [Dehalococcoidia bacterium]
MPSFDVVSKTNIAEVDNALNNIKREIGQRFDFKNSKCSIDRTDNTLTVLADDELKLRQLHEMVKVHFTRRAVDIEALAYKEAERAAGDSLRQTVTIRQGIDSELAKKMVKGIKDSKIKVQTTIQGDELRVTGKNRDDLQAAIALIKDMGLGLPVQFANFRD